MCIICFFINCLVSFCSIDGVCEVLIFSRLINPVWDPFSNGRTVADRLLMSELKCWYFSVFNLWASLILLSPGTSIQISSWKSHLKLKKYCFEGWGIYSFKIYNVWNIWNLVFSLSTNCAAVSECAPILPYFPNALKMR